MVWKDKRDTAKRSSRQKAGGIVRSALSEQRTLPTVFCINQRGAGQEACVITKLFRIALSLGTSEVFWPAKLVSIYYPESEKVFLFVRMIINCEVLCFSITK